MDPKKILENNLELSIQAKKDLLLDKENLEILNIANPQTVIKVDDTLVGIQEGINANCITVAVARWSVNMGIHNIQDAFELSDFDVYRNLIKSREILNESGADYVINTLDELPPLINKLNLKKIYKYNFIYT